MDSLASTPLIDAVRDLMEQPNQRLAIPVTKVISDEERLIFEIINYVTMCTIVGLFGIVSNAINIVVFFKQGFNNTVNISFFGLAISDMCCLVTLEWVCICLNPLFVNSGIPWIPNEVQYLSGAWPHVCFSRITSLITAYITAERCLCIAIPLNVKQIVTPMRTKTAIFLIYFINLVSLLPEYATSYVGWRFFPNRNSTLLALSFTSNRRYVEGLVFVLNSTLGMASFAAVILFTIILIVKLQYNSEWRRTSISLQENQDGVTKRDKKTMKMVTIIAIILIVCYTPGTIISMTTFVVPEFNLLGGYVNICMATWSFVFLFQAVNSSVNIFLYYAMSSIYRMTFNEIFFYRGSSSPVCQRLSVPAMVQRG